MTIGRRITATAQVPLRKVRAAAAEALTTVDQHAHVINGQKQRLEAYGAQLADMVEWARGMERRVAALEQRSNSVPAAFEARSLVIRHVDEDDGA